jgi:Flp pilus assembly protein TadG
MQLLKRMRLDKPKGFWRDDRAVTAVEFAFIGPMFFFMLFTVLETGAILFTEYVLQTSVQEAARFVRTGQAQEQKMTAATFKTKICDLAGRLLDCTGKVTVYMRADADFPTLAANTPSYLSIGPAGLPADPASAPVSYNCGAPAQAVALIATYDWNFYIIPSWSTRAFFPPEYMTFMGNRNGGATRRLAAFAIFENEPFPTVAGNVCP